MKYTDRLLNNDEFKQIMEHVKELEAERIYCHHELEHALDVCRIAWIMYLEDTVTSELVPNELEYMKDHLYVIGLLHDIGRCAQYEGLGHHSEVGAAIAERLLEEIDYPESLRDEIIGVVKTHFGRENYKNAKYMDIEEKFPAYYIGMADQLSRNCFSCKAIDTCKWEEDEFNRTINY